MEAGDAIEARDRIERQMKSVTDECSNLKIKLNSERARHAETAEQSRALTHLAAQMRSKNEKLEKVNDKQSTEIKMLRKVVFHSSQLPLLIEILASYYGRRRFTDSNLSCGCSH